MNTFNIVEKFNYPIENTEDKQYHILLPYNWTTSFGLYVTGYKYSELDTSVNMTT
jgi:hypothetical protein